MFKQLKELVGDKGTLVLTVAGAPDGMLRVTVMPKGEFKDAALMTPLQLTGTDQELDAEFAQLLSTYATHHRSLLDQTNETLAIIDAATKASSESSQKAIQKATAKPKADAPAKPQAEAPAEAPAVAAHANNEVELF